MSVSFGRTTRRTRCPRVGEDGPGLGAGPDDDLVRALGQHLPAKRLRPEPGQAGQVVSVNDDVVESHGHAVSMVRARARPEDGGRISDQAVVRISVPRAAGPGQPAVPAELTI